jgi:hypothetical protein
MNLLAQILSGSNRLKRYVSDFVEDPVGNIQQAVGYANDRAGNLNRLTALAAKEHVQGIKSGAPMGQAQNKLAQLMADAYNPMGMVVWHGSPHKFTKFDSSKIGTGEGAQAYGHGLYLAESPDVASAYKKNLSKDTFVSPNGSVINRAKLADFGFDRGDIDVMLGAIQKHNGDFTAAADAMASHRPTAAKFLKGIGQQGSINEGSLYKVDLPDDAIAKMLDWDKPLSRQSDELKELLEPMIPEIRKSSRMDFLGDVLGKGLYESVGNGVKSPETARKMQALGIPGIRYLDGGSRGAGAGTSNFVVFPGNEGLLSILERNGQPVK